jgi:hypothetical protein
MQPAERLWDGPFEALAMAATEDAFDFRRLAAQVVLVGLVVTVALSDFGNPAFAAVGFLSGLLLVLAAVDAVREHPLYPVAFGVVIMLAGVAGIVINGPGFFVAVLVLGGLAFLVDWGYRRYERA